MSTTAARTADSADALQAQLVDAVIERTGLRDQRVVDALRAVPRHLCAPAGTPLPKAYADDTVITKHHPNTRRARGSLSAPWLVATMLAQRRTADLGQTAPAGKSPTGGSATADSRRCATNGRAVQPHGTEGHAE